MLGQLAYSSYIDQAQFCLSIIDLIITFLVGRLIYYTFMINFMSIQSVKNSECPKELEPADRRTSVHVELTRRDENYPVCPWLFSHQLWICSMSGCGFHDSFLFVLICTGTSEATTPPFPRGWKNFR